MIKDIPQIQQDIAHYYDHFDVAKGGVVVDIGAHVGLFTASCLDIASKVYAVEPDPMFFKQLKKIRHKNVVPVNVGIASEDGVARIKSDGYAHALIPVHDVSGVKVKTITFKSLISKYNIKKIDFLKVDCEGAEYDLFTEETVKWLSEHCNKIAGEFHIHSDTHRIGIKRVLELFTKFGFHPTFTTVKGNVISKSELLNKLNYFTELLFYINLTTMPTQKKKTSKKSIAGRQIYNDVKQQRQAPLKKVVFNEHFCGGATLELQGPKNNYLVEFTDGKNNLYRNTVETHPVQGKWLRCNLSYYIPYKIKVTDLKTKQPVFSKTLNLEGRKVYVELGSSSLGDTIAWFPYVDQFQKAHKCDLTVMTYHNYLFKGAYPNLKFNEPGQTYDAYASYLIGWHYDAAGQVDFTKHRIAFRQSSIQATAADILGLPRTELKPTIDFKHKNKPVTSKYVCIANHATLQAKYWNNPVGWQKLVDYLRKQGYTVVLLSKEPDGFNGNDNPKGVQQPKNYDMDTIMNYLYHCEFFVGLGSGLTWLSWALNKPTVLISGFSEPYTEMSQGIIRIGAKEGMCSGCFNRVKLQDNGEWMWCPDHGDNPKRAFECTRTITAQDVIDRIQPLLKKK